MTSRWPAVTGLWLAFPAWGYAVLGAGLLAAAGAALRERGSLAAGTAGTSVLVALGVLFGIREIRSGY